MASEINRKLPSNQGRRRIATVYRVTDQVGSVEMHLSKLGFKQVLRAGHLCGESFWFV